VHDADCYGAFNQDRHHLSTRHVFFLQYSSRSRSAAICGSKFAEFLRDLLRLPAQHIVNPSLPSSAPRATLPS
jgi:hypothetical protein